MITRRDTFILEPAIIGQRLIGLRDDDVILFICRQVTNIIRNLMVLLIHLAVRRLHEAELVHAGIVRERADQTDIRTFWGLNRAHAAIMRVMDIANLKASALTRKSAWA